jgi:hypothetical protein
MTAEEKILLLSSFYSLSPAHTDVFSGLLTQVPDWNKIIAASRFHSLAPLIVKHISNGNFQGKLSSSSWEKLIGIARQQTARRLRIITVFLELSSIFKEQNIEFILLKGLCISDSYYPNPSLRPMQDIDLLVHTNALDRVISLMERLSASRIVELQSDFINSFLHHIPPFNYKDVIIEIHTNLVPANETFSFTADILWNNTVNVEIQKSHTRVLSMELNLIYLYIHLYRHVRTNKFRLIWFSDLMLILSSSNTFDIEKISSLAKQIGSEETIKNVSYLLNKFWNFKLPGDFLTNITEPDKRVIQNFKKGILRQHNPDEYYTLQAWSRIPGIKNKFRFALGLAFPSAAYMKKKYLPRTSLSLILLYPYNSIKVVLKGLKTLFLR